MTKKSDELRVNKIIHREKVEVTHFEALLYLFERNFSILGRSKSNFENYARTGAANFTFIKFENGTLNYLKQPKSGQKIALP